jgi:hypothetical protein
MYLLSSVSAPGWSHEPATSMVGLGDGSGSRSIQTPGVGVDIDRISNKLYYSLN